MTEKKILIIDDDEAICVSLSVVLKRQGYQTRYAQSPQAAVQLLQTESKPQLILLDMNFSPQTSGEQGLNFLAYIRKDEPEIPVILITGWATIELAVKGMKMGAADFISKPWDNGHLLNTIQTIININHQYDISHNREKLDSRYDFTHIIGKSPAFLKILDTIGRIASTDASVLIKGESGTGKELIAEAIHQNSLRKKQAFVKVNLGGISSSLFESEMFGHVKGAFTDARYDRKGRFELADKGTIFLDEIGDLELANQVKLLRVLQDRTYEVLGSSKSKTIDVRVVAATNRNLDEMIADGSFREDLLYRINLITIYLPSLRERPEDIPLLVDFFLKNLGALYSRSLSISQEALSWIQSLPLPGNVRELKNLIERTCLVSPSDKLELKDFMQHYQPVVSKQHSSLPNVGAMTLEELEVQMIHKAMEFHRGKLTQVAKSLGLTRSSLYRRLEKYNIPYNSD
ncbi:MAG TPA: sigma-54 dependent transcriptional regulator [Saprospiraceae bacterium]|nr:sigma-54 dependent transcriptional regulator [Saprospiraceae bacterium]HMQ82308.1 sigma-54 dependent transcriptional regulator [Saprospiraceae bacterium]